MFSLSNHTWLGNTIMDYFWFLVILVAGLLLRRKITFWIAALLYTVLGSRAKAVGRQKLVQLLLDPVRIFISALVVFWAFSQLNFPSEWHLAAKEQFGFRYLLVRLFELMLIFSGFWTILRLVDYAGLIFLHRAGSTTSLADDQLVIFSKEAIKVVIALIGLFILAGTAFELDVVSLITGLGIGGLAFALAAKETLENLLGSFTIFLDKPFVSGDNVRVGNVEGTVESVGFRSTRIRSADKMMVTVPNKKMVDAELINDSDRVVRRAAFSILLSHDTTEQQVRRVVSEIHELLNANLNLERKSNLVRFRNILDKGLEVFIVYIALTADYIEFTGIQEDINYSIMRILESNNVVLAKTGREA